MQETQFYADPAVVVTSARVIINGTTYALSNISSVRLLIAKRPMSWAVLGFVLMVLGLLLLPLGASALGTMSAMAGLGIVLIYFFVLRDKHWVILVTAGAEHRAFEAPDVERVHSILNAINAAIVHRG